MTLKHGDLSPSTIIAMVNEHWNMRHVKDKSDNPIGKYVPKFEKADTTDASDISVEFSCKGCAVLTSR